MRRAAQRVLVGEELVEGGAVRRIERDRERPGLVVADIVPGRLLQRGAVLLPAPGSLEQQFGQGRLSELHLGHRGQHAGGDPRGTVAPGGRGDQGDLVPAGGEPPGAREPDDASPNDEHPVRHGPQLTS